MARALISLTRCFKQGNIIYINRHMHKIKPIDPNKQSDETHAVSLQLHQCYSQTTPFKCWKCGLERNSITDLFCEKCRTIQNPSQLDNYFKVFKLEENFAVDPKLLTHKYREMQSVLHPDKFSNKSPEEQRISEQFSSLLNKAYNVLQSPLERAIHLLGLRGEKIDEDQKVDDPAFLMEIMELNEEVEAANSPDKLKELNVKNKKMLKTLADNIDECFKKDDIQKAKKEIIKMKYYNSVGLHVNSILRERGIVD